MRRASPSPSYLLPALLLLAGAAPPRAGVLGDDLNEEETSDYASLTRLRLSADAGLSQWIMPDDSTLSKAGKAYVDDQQSARNLAADAIWYFLPRGGVGLSWIWFLSRTRADDLVFRAGDIPHDIDERLSIAYLGPSFWTRVHAGRYGLVHAGFGAGYLSLRDTWTDNGEAVKVEAKTYALVTSVGWDYSIMRYLGIGLNGRFLFANVREWTRNGERVRLEDPDDRYFWYNVPLYRLELNAGVRVFL